MKELKRLRESRGLTQEGLAIQLGVSKSYYVKLENDFVKPSYNTLKKLKDYYGTELDLNALVE